MEYPKKNIPKKLRRKQKNSRMEAVRKGDILYYTVPKSTLEEDKAKSRYQRFLIWLHLAIGECGT